MRQKLLIAGLVIGGLGMIAFGGMRYLSHQAIGNTALDFMNAMTAADVDTLAACSSPELARDIRRRAAIDNWQPDADVTHRLSKVHRTGADATAEIYSSKSGMRLQTSTLQLTRVDSEWRVTGGSFELGKRWLKLLKEQQQDDAKQLFDELQKAVEDTNRD